MTEESSVKVCVRVRPVISREMEVDSSVTLYWKDEEHCVSQNDATKSFTFDRVFSAQENTLTVYQQIAHPVVVSALEGYNGTVFAYGQTSSGKTFTMMGDDASYGIIQLAINDIFKCIDQTPQREFLLRISYMEIYNETITDLLCDSRKKKPLEIREDIHRKVYVADLTEEVVMCPKHVLEWIKKGEKNRHYGYTKMNERSSRSHTIFRMILESREKSDSDAENGAVMVSHLNLVDLAGSERASQTGAAGLRLKEGCNINKSLFILGQVIKKLSDGQAGGFINYRDSKLTRILQNSLGGNAKTIIICTITPAALEETLSTLQFASTAKYMKNEPRVNEVLSEEALLRRYRNQIVDLEKLLDEVSSKTRLHATEKEHLTILLQEKEQLQREQEDRIKNLTKMIINSSNFSCQEPPITNKRRVTWAPGKLLQSLQSSKKIKFDETMSFQQSVKYKFGSTTLPEFDLLDSTEFDLEGFSHTSDDTTSERNCSNITVQRSKNIDSSVIDEFSVFDALSSGSNSNSFQSEEMKAQIVNLEQQLQTETAEKLKESEMRITLEKRVFDLEQQLMELQKVKQEELDGLTVKNVSLNSSMSEVCLQTSGCFSDMESLKESADVFVQSENSEKLVTSFEDGLQSHEKQDNGDVTACVSQCELDKALSKLKIVRSECKNLTNENENLRLEIGVLEYELKEKDEINTFISLEQSDLKNEIATLKAATDDAESLISQLKAELENKRKQLSQQEEWISELQKPGDKTLLQQISQFKQSLKDAEAMTIDARKETSFLRSENLELTSKMNEMSIKFNEMEKSLLLLQSQLESEKMRYKKMQSDLQKELNQAFAENTKLTCLLDGKVPKDIIEQVEMEKVVFSLKKELEQALSEKVCIQTELAAAASLQDLPEKVEILSEQLKNALFENKTLLQKQLELSAETEELKMARKRLSDEYNSEDVKPVYRQHQDQHTMEMFDSDEQKDKLDGAKEETEELKMDVQKNTEDLQKLLDEVASLTKEKNELLEMINSLTAETNELKADMKDSIEMSIEVQEELRTAQEGLKQQRSLVRKLKAQNFEKDEIIASLEEKMLKTTTHEDLEKLVKEAEEKTVEPVLIREPEEKLDKEIQTSPNSEVNQVTVELPLTTTEQNQLLNKTCEHSDRMLDEISALTTDRNNLQQRLEDVQCELHKLRKNAEQSLNPCEWDKVLQDKSMMEKELENCKNENRITSNELKTLKVKFEEQEIVLLQFKDDYAHVMNANDCLQRTLDETVAENNHLKLTVEDDVQQVKQLIDELQLVTVERNQLLVQIQESSDKSEFEKKQHNISLLQTERSDLCKKLDDVQAELSELRKSTEGCHNATEWKELCAERDDLLQSKTRLTEELDKTKSNIHAISTELERLKTSEEQKIVLLQLEGYMNSVNTNDCLQKTLEGSLGERDALQTKVEDHINQLTQVKEELQLVIAERDQLLSQINAISKVPELEHLQQQISLLTNEKNSLSKKLDDAKDELSELKKNAEGSHNVSEWNEICIEQDNLQAKSNLEELENTKNTGSDELESLNVKFEEQKVILLQLKDDYAHTVNENDRLQNRLQEAVAERDAFQSKVEDRTLQVKQVADELQLITTERDQLLCQINESSAEPEFEKMQQQISLLTFERNDLCRNLDQVQAELAELIKSTKGSHNASDWQKLCHERDGLLLDKTQLADELDKIKNENCGALRELETLKVTFEVQQLAVLQLKDDYAHVTNETDLLRNTIEEVLAERDQLKMKTEDLNQECINTQEDLKSTTEKLAKQGEEFESFKRQAGATESQLHEKVNQINDKLELALAERDQLYNKQDESTKEYEQKLGKLMEECILITNEKNTIQAQLNDVQVNLSDLRKTTEGCRNATEWEELCAERDDLLQSKTRLTEELDNTKSNIHATSTELERLRKTSEEQKLVLLQLEEDYMNSVKVNDCLQKTLEVSLDEKDALQTKVEDHIQQLTQVKEELQLVIAERDQLLSQINEISKVPELKHLQQQISLLTNEKINLSKKLDDAQDELSELKKNAEGSHNVSEWNEMCIERDNLLQAKSNLEEELEKNIGSDELESLNVKFKEQQVILLQLKDDYAHTVNENDCLQNRLQEAVAERDVLQSKVEALTLQVKQVDDELQLITTERDQLLRQINESSAEPEFEKMQQQISLLTFERNDLCRNLDQVQAELAKLIKSTKGSHNASDWQELCHERDGLLLDKTKLENELDKIKNENYGALKELETLKATFEEQQLSFLQLKDDYAHVTNETDRLRNNLEEVLAERDQLKIKTEDLNQECINTQEDLKSTTEKLTKQWEEFESFKRQAAATKSQLNEKVNQINHKLELALAERDQLYNKQDESTKESEQKLGKLMEECTLITNEKNTIQAQLNDVQENLSDLRKKTEGLHDAADWERLCSERDELLKSKDILEVELQRIKEEGIITSKELETFRATFEDQVLTLQQLKDDFTNCKAAIDRLQKIKNGVVDERDLLKKEIEDYIQKYLHAQDDLRNAKDELRMNEQAQENLKRQFAEKEAELNEKINLAAVKLESVLAEKDQLCTKKNKSSKEFEFRLDQLLKQITSLTNERDEVLRRLADVQNELTELQKSTEGLHCAAEWDQLCTERDEIWRSKTELDAELERIKTEYLVTTNELETLKVTFQDQKQMLVQLKEEYANMVTARDELQKTLESVSKKNVARREVGEHLEQTLPMNTQLVKKMPLDIACEKTDTLDDSVINHLQRAEEQSKQILDHIKKVMKEFQNKATSKESIKLEDIKSQNEVLDHWLSSIPTSQKTFDDVKADIKKKHHQFKLLIRKIMEGFEVYSGKIVDHYTEALHFEQKYFEEIKKQYFLSQILMLNNNSSTTEIFERTLLPELLEKQQMHFKEIKQVLGELDTLFVKVGLEVMHCPEELKADLSGFNPSESNSLKIKALFKEQSSKMWQQIEKGVHTIGVLRELNSAFKKKRQIFKCSSEKSLEEEKKKTSSLTWQLASSYKSESPDSNTTMLTQENEKLLNKIVQKEVELEQLTLTIKDLQRAHVKAEENVAAQEKELKKLLSKITELQTQLNKKDMATKDLEDQLRKLQLKFKEGAGPLMEEIETLKTQLVRMDLERTGIARTHEQQINCFKAALQLKEDALRDLKENLRRCQQQQEQSFIEEANTTSRPFASGGGSGIVQSTLVLILKSEKAKLESEVLKLNKKNKHLESAVSSLQEELSKWKVRARRMGENFKKSQLPHTPSPQRKTISEATVLSPQKDIQSTYIHRSGSTQFFDNSKLEGLTDENPAVEANKNEQNWWSSAPQKGSDAPECKTQ
ncbi:centromere-associated protein E [Erpetoichthys calabaricus]|uniref:centromere-associated protein E n=1 Tax=Erpetoichthys calabaricus TaxID=27687 RepID=UPI00223424C3|nr:centromere-associated protein E [Erpetoichthys calabaricus]